MKKIIWKILRFLRVAAPIQLLISGYLYEKGWFSSFYKKSAIDNNGIPIPWISYPCFHFIQNRIQPHFEIFEYGSGNSTLWFAPRVKNIISVEHNEAWANMMRKEIDENVELIYEPLEYNGSYSKSINRFYKRFHIIIIDGRDRVNCAKTALNHLSDDGIILFDNTDRKAYQPAIQFLIEQGFRTIEFEGMSPGTHVTGATTIFYKENNCLGI